MTPFDLSALAAALPAGTGVATDPLGGIIIGGTFTAADDATPFSEPAASWPASVTSPEQMLALAYFTAQLQVTMGAEYAIALAAGTLPTWTPGAALPA